MRFVWSYLKKYWQQFLLATLLSFIAGLGLMWPLKELNQVIKGGVENVLVLSATIVICLVAYVFLGQWAERILARVSYLTILEMRLDLVKKIYSATYHEIEGRRNELFSSLVTDTQFIGRKLEKIPTVVKNLVISFGGIGYLLFVSWQMSTVLILVFASVGGLIFVRNKRAYRLTKTTRKSFDAVYNSLHDSIHGMKELSQDEKFRNHYFQQYVDRSSREEAHHKVRLRTHNQLTNHLSEAALILGILMMVIMVFQLGFGTKPILVEFLAIALFIVKPVSSVTDFVKGALPVAAITDHIEQLGLILRTSARKSDQSLAPGKRDILIQGISYQYPGKKYPAINNLSTTIRSGEITLIYGGNGSGKTTLAKIICGLYLPSGGSLSLSGKEINERNLQHYRGKIATIFTDGHLFKNQEVSIHQLPQFKEHLELMGLKEVVQLNQNRIRTDNLSTGQGKRLALILSILSDKEIYVFDEWAANQDPEFKEAFYFRLLPELKASGKTILLITHDDQFFGIADSRIKISSGQVIEEIYA